MSLNSLKEIQSGRTNSLDSMNYVSPLIESIINESSEDYGVVRLNPPIQYTRMSLEKRV